MKVLVLLLWAGCLLSIGGWVVRLVWLSTLWERLLVLALAGAAVRFRRPVSQRGAAHPPI